LPCWWTSAHYAGLASPNWIWHRVWPCTYIQCELHHPRQCRVLRVSAAYSTTTMCSWSHLAELTALPTASLDVCKLLHDSRTDETRSTECWHSSYCYHPAIMIIQLVADTSGLDNASAIARLSDQVLSASGSACQKIFVWQQATGSSECMFWLWQQLGILRGGGWCIAIQSGCLMFPVGCCTCFCYLDVSKHVHEVADYTQCNRLSYCGVFTAFGCSAALSLHNVELLCAFDRTATQCATQSSCSWP